LEFGTKSKIDF